MKTNCFPFIDIFELLHFQVLHLIKGGLQLGHLYNPFNGNNDSDWGPFSCKEANVTNPDRAFQCVSGVL